MPESSEVYPPHGVILPLDVVQDPNPPGEPALDTALRATAITSYSPERQRDLVRLIVASGLLLILGYLIVFATVEASSYPAHWTQTKELLQIILPAVTGILGTVIGFYFGTTALSQAKASSDSE